MNTQSLKIHFSTVFSVNKIYHSNHFPIKLCVLALHNINIHLTIYVYYMRMYIVRIFIIHMHQLRSYLEILNYENFHTISNRELLFEYKFCSFDWIYILISIVNILTITSIFTCSSFLFLPISLCILIQ